MGRKSEWICAAAGLWALGVSAAQAQDPAATRALTDPAQAKVAAPPAAASVKAGEGGGPAGAPQTLAAAIEACDLERTLALGGTAKDAARVLKGQGMASSSMDPTTAVWVKSGADSWGMAYQALGTGGRGFVTPAAFKGYVPPGLETLPTTNEAFGPPPPPPGPTPDMIELGQKVMDGMSAQEAATRFLAVHPPADERVADPAQAVFTRGTVSTGVVLVIPSFGGTRGGLTTSMVQLPGTEAYPGLAAMRAQNDSTGAPMYRPPPGISMAVTPPPSRPALAEQRC